MKYVGMLVGGKSVQKTRPDAKKQDKPKDARPNGHAPEKPAAPASEAPEKPEGPEAPKTEELKAEEPKDAKPNGSESKGK